MNNPDIWMQFEYFGNEKVILLGILQCWYCGERLTF